MTRTLVLAIVLLCAVSKAFAGTWTVPLPELDGTHESIARGSDNPQFIEFDVPLEIPANIAEIGSATMIATISRTDGLVECCFDEGPCPTSPETPVVAFVASRPDSCGGDLYASDETAF